MNRVDTDMLDCCTARNLMFYVADVANQIDLKGHMFT